LESGLYDPLHYTAENANRKRASRPSEKDAIPACAVTFFDDRRLRTKLRKKRKHLVAARENHFRMPLNAHDEVLSRHFDSFDDPVEARATTTRPSPGTLTA
jgi:hypothetical protein